MKLNNKKIAFIFPGQGSQVPGMGKDFYENYKVSKEIYDMAEDICQMKIKAMCFEGNEEIKQTKNMQICIFTTCIAILEAMRKEGIESSVNAGLSVGEYAALAASKVIDIENLMRLVKNRGIYMQESYAGEGAMAAISTKSIEIIEAVCNQSDGMVNIANYNGPLQTVISGEAKAVERAIADLESNNIKNIFRLNVSGAFHSKFMEPAQNKLATLLEEMQINDYTVPYVSNVLANYVTDKSQVKELLVKQITHSVRWHQSVNCMIDNQVDCFIEIGPGRSLTNLLRTINKDVDMISISKLDNLHEIL